MKRKPNPAPLNPEEAVEKIRSLLAQLEEEAKQGGSMAEFELDLIRREIFWAFAEDIKKKARAGYRGYEGDEQPIGTLLKMADFVIPLLLWLTENDTEDVKKYASLRWTWPAYVALMSDAERPYQQLLPLPTKSGESRGESPIHLGNNLGLNISRARTLDDLLFKLAVQVKRVLENKVVPGWSGLYYQHKLKAEYETIPEKLKGIPQHPKWSDQKSGARALDYEHWLGELNRNNWKKWRPVIDDYLTDQLGPPEARWASFSRKDDHWIFTQDEGLLQLWCDQQMEWKQLTAIEATQILIASKKLNWKSRGPSLPKVNIPEVRKIVDTANTPEGKWKALKKELLNRIYRLLPRS